MNKFSKPIKNFTPDDITQSFHDNHKAIDFVENSVKRYLQYGLPLCAPEDVEIIQIWGDKYSPHSELGLRRGYGIKMLGKETRHKHTYWHTLPIHPVSVGDHVKRGKIVAYMGNAGTVFQGGVAVPLDERNKKPYPGTHCHWVTYNKNNKQIDPTSLLDWNLEPTYTIYDQLKSIAIVLFKMSNLINNR